VITPVSFQDFIQTDLQINPENSGAPLMDDAGRVVGILDVFLTRRAGFEGIGFAVPWNMAAYVIRQIRMHGKVERGWLGIRVQDVLLRSRQTPHRFIRGVMVVEVHRDGPGFTAGLQPGDVILRYGRQPVMESSALKRLVSNTPVGQVEELLVLRKGHRQNVRVKVGTRDQKKTGAGRSVLSRRLGIDVMPLAERHGTSSSRSGGVVITRVDADSPMERAGFEIDDLIIEANGRPIRSGRDLEKILRGLSPGQHITFLAVDHRTNRTGYVQVRPR
jgi:serine protease Do